MLLQTVRARVGSPNNVTSANGVRILFDSCSQKSYISARLRNELQLPTIRTDRILVKTFGKEEGSLKSCDVVQVAVDCVDGMKVFVNAYVVPLICSPITNQPINFAQSHYPHLRNIELSDQASGGEELEVDIMIGADYYWCFVQNQVVCGEGYGPVAILTRLGYVLSGPVSAPMRNETFSNVTISHVMKTTTAVEEHDIQLIDQVKKFWEYESMGINENDSVHEDFITNINFTGDRYEVSLPFKQGHGLIPDNFSLAESRLRKLKNTLPSSVLNQYDEVIKEQLSSGVIESVNPDEIKKPGHVHYMPHKPVIRSERATTKLRVVYDASSKRDGEVSLNDCLNQGPSLFPLIFDVLLRFRLHKVALIGDIEKAFLNIQVREEERDLLRFLWYEDINSDQPDLVKFRFTRLVFGLVSSPFVLNATVRYHLKNFAKEDTQFTQKVIDSLYVDDFASGEDSDEEGLKLYQKLKACFRAGGFNMRKWASNSATLSREIKNLEEREKAEVSLDEDESYSKSTLNKTDSCQDNEIKVLGITWNTETDKLYFKFTPLTDEINSHPTKREILQFTAKFYDPLGLVSPIVVPFKCIFQELCRLKVDWDAPIPEDVAERWQKLIEDMKKTESVSVPRYVIHFNSDQILSVQLHGFSDASKSAYGANIYLRIETPSSISTRLITSKTKVAPLKEESIPRLELLAACILAKLITSVKAILEPKFNIARTVCWSDSQIALWWIYGESSQFKQFVHNRVKAIISLTGKECWRYCPTKSNPSDITSRGAKASEISDNSLWWEGPKYLEEKEESWPNILSYQTNRKEIPEEAKREIRKTTSVLVNKVDTNPEDINNIIPCENYSRLGRLLRVTALVLKFIKRVRKQDTDTSPEITVEDLDQSRVLWIKHAQASLTSERNQEQMFRNLRVFKDEAGVFRCGGRMNKSSMPYESKFPILLPRDHQLTKLIIIDAHQKVYHNGVRETLTEIRANYWITKGRQQVKRVINCCVVCKKIQGLNYTTPQSAPLPDFRVSEEHAFTNVGVDHAGPLFVKNIYDHQGEMYKCHLALFTCCTTRALHLEITPDLTGEAFLRTLKRFIGRRGIPSVINSDNGKTFKDSKVRSFCVGKNISWKFNVARASWWGGYFEICVKLVKRCLRKVLKTARLSYEELETVVVEIEGILNSRPLTYVYDEITEPPLTPSSLMFGRRLLDQARPGDSDSQTQDRLKRRALYIERLIGQFRNRWKAEYLTSLREHHREKTTRQERIPRLGDMVHIQADKTPRQQWKLGKIVKLLKGTDNQIRAAEVMTQDKSQRMVTLQRPVQKLYPLEVRSSAEERKSAELTVVRDEDIGQVVIGGRV